MRLEEFVDHGHLVVRAELPGIDPEKDIHVVVDEGLLTITGERRSETKQDQKGGSTSQRCSTARLHGPFRCPMEHVRRT